jgi:hypothetical protein
MQVSELADPGGEVVSITNRRNSPAARRQAA